MVDTDLASVLWFVVPGIAAPVILLVMAFRSPTRSQLDRWASGSGVALTLASEPMIRAHLGRGRRFRALGSFPFWWLAALPVLTGHRLPVPVASIPIGGYLAGAVLAELVGSRVPADGVRHASLLPRTVRDFLPTWVRVVPWALLGLGIAMLALQPVVHVADEAPDRPWLLVSLALAIMAVAELAIRRITHQPQRGADLDVLAADDALRATGASTAVGASALVGLLMANLGLQSLLRDQWVWIGLPLWLVGNGLGYGVLAAVVRQENWGYRVRRRRLPTVAVS